jgi:hypothetical protein
MAGDDFARGHVAYDHRTRANQCACSYFDSAHHDRAASNRGAFPDHGMFHLPVGFGLQRRDR